MLTPLSFLGPSCSWWVILLSYLRFYYGMRAQNMSRDDLPYKAPFQPYASWFGVIFVTAVVIFNGFPVFLRGQFTASGFFAAYINVAIFFFCYAGWKAFGGRRDPERKSFFSLSSWVTLEFVHPPRCLTSPSFRLFRAFLEDACRLSLPLPP
jgi:amino acid permease